MAAGGGWLFGLFPIACWASFVSVFSKPHQVSPSDLFHLVYTGDLSASNAVDCHNGDITTVIHGMWRRWELALSLLVQMALLKVKTPMAVLGSAIENGLNCFYMSGNSLKTLFANILLGM